MKRKEAVKPPKKPTEPVSTPTEKLPAPILEMKPTILDTEDFNQIVAQAEKEIESIKKIKVLSLRVTNERDWVNHNGNPYLEVMGSMKIGQVWGISIKEMKQETIRQSDEDGEYYIIRTEGKAEFKGRIISEIGTCTSRDDFFGVKNKEWKALEDVSCENVMKASATNFHNRVIKKILGLAPTWEDLKEAGLKKENIRSINMRQSGATEEDGKKQTEVRNMLREMYLDAGHLAKLTELSAFVGEDLKTVAGVKAYEDLQGIRLSILRDKVTKIYTGWKKDIAGSGSGTQKPATDAQKPATDATKQPAGQVEAPPADEPAGIVTIDIITAKEAPFANIGHLKGCVGDMTVTEVGSKTPRTKKSTMQVYQDAETDNFIEVFMWGDQHEKFKNGDIVIFKDVIKSDYKGTTQYNAKTAEIDIPF